MSDIQLKKVSDLDELLNPSGYWIFGYKNENGTNISKKVSWDQLLKTVSITTPIALLMETTEQRIPIGAPTIIYKANCKSVDSMRIKAFNDPTDNNWIDVPIDGTACNIDLSPFIDTDILLQIVQTPNGVNNVTSSIYLYCKTTLN